MTSGNDQGNQSKQHISGRCKEKQPDRSGTSWRVTWRSTDIAKRNLSKSKYCTTVHFFYDLYGREFLILEEMRIQPTDRAFSIFGGSLIMSALSMLMIYRFMFSLFGNT